MRVLYLSLISVVLFSVVSVPVVAQVDESVAPEDVGLSRSRLARLDSVMQSYVDRQHVSGAVALVARHGGIAHLKAYGMADVERRWPMRPNTIFRIASMSKAITSVAAMMLFEEGHFLLNQPVAKVLPEFDAPQVLVLASDQDSTAAPYSLVDAGTPITFRHLLTHTSGITYRFIADFAGPEERAVKHLAALYRDADVSDGLTQTEGTIGEMVSRLAAQPLLHEPGARFSYGLSTDVLGRVVEVLGGATFEEFLEERLFKPLGIEDTYFFLPDDKVDRLAMVYRPTDDGGIAPLGDTVVVGPNMIYSASYPVRGPRTYFSGGAGLSSTAYDYWRFLQMLLNGGELDGVRVLSRKTVELMTTDHIADIESGTFAFGLGFSIQAPPGRTGVILTEGAYGWGGFWNTRFWVDPEEDLIGIVMTQVFPANHTDILDKFQVMVYQAIID